MRVLLLAIASIVVCSSSVLAVDKSTIDAAVARGVAYLKKQQKADGTWQHDKIGATALCGLTLLECGVDPTDKSVTQAADACRKVALDTMHTYSLSLLIIFLDRLDRPEDTPLIEAMVVNLLAGQYQNGYWGYDCIQAFTAAEQRDLRAEASGTRELKTGRDLSKLSAKGTRAATELPKMVQGKLSVIARGGHQKGPTNSGGDLSNTQFATLAMWAGRRYGVSTQAGLARTDQGCRAAQSKDGSWGYLGPVVGQMTATATTATVEQGTTVSAAMTCAGVLGLVCGHGAKADAKKDREGMVTIDVSGDKQLTLGLSALANAVGDPTGWDGKGQSPQATQQASGKAFYYLWSLERVCVMLGLETLGKKDWYRWGAEVLLASQQGDGSWAGEYTEGHSDTCFALLFLRKVNLFRDLRNGKNGLKDPVTRSLKGGGPVKGEKPLVAIDIGSKPTKDKQPEEDKNKSPEEKAAAKLVERLRDAKEKERTGLLKELRDSKGSAYTEALVEAVKVLEGQAKKETREALADRLTRMKATTLREFFKEETELRRAAAIAAGQRDAKELVPDLIKLLDDREPIVQRAARAALEAISGKKLGDRSGPWQEWWKTQTKE